MCIDDGFYEYDLQCWNSENSQYSFISSETVHCRIQNGYFTIWFKIKFKYTICLTDGMLRAFPIRLYLRSAFFTQDSFDVCGALPLHVLCLWMFGLVAAELEVWRMCGQLVGTDYLSFNQPWYAESVARSVRAWSVLEWGRSFTPYQTSLDITKS